MAKSVFKVVFSVRTARYLGGATRVVTIDLEENSLEEAIEGLKRELIASGYEILEICDVVNISTPKWRSR